MNLTDRGKVYLFIALLSLLFSYLVITLRFFPHFGMSISFITFLIFTYTRKKEKERSDRIYFVFSLLFSLMLFIRSEPVVTFFNFWAAIFFGFLALLPRKKALMTYLDYVYAPILFVVKGFLAKSDYYPEFREKKENFKVIKIEEIILGTLITVILLAVVIPLLSSTNPFFQKLVTDIWESLRLSNLFKNLGPEIIFTWVIRTVFFLFFLYVIPKVITLINKTGINYDLKLPFLKSELPLRIPKIILSVILTIFFVTQIQFYMADNATLVQLGYTHSQYAREVFAQLTLVAGIVLFLIYNDNVKAKLNKVLNWILGVQGFFLTAMAYKSAFEYINAWGLTYIRLYGLTFATWVTGIFVLFFVNYYRNGKAVNFVKNSVIFSGVILLLVNILNYDYLIYHFKKAATGQGVDYTYLSMLSADSLSYKDQYNKLEKAIETGDYSIEAYNNQTPLVLIHNIKRLQEKYKVFDIRTMSLLDYIQYRKIKTVDTSRSEDFFRNYRFGKI